MIEGAALGLYLLESILRRNLSVSGLGFENVPQKVMYSRTALLQVLSTTQSSDKGFTKYYRAESNCWMHVIVLPNYDLLTIGIELFQIAIKLCSSQGGKLMWLLLCKRLNNIRRS